MNSGAEEAGRRSRGVAVAAPPLGWLLLGGVALLLTSCLTRSQYVDPADSAELREQAEMYVLEHAEERWGYRRSGPRNRRSDYNDGNYLHLGGTTTCTGWPRKKQETHLYAWVTERTPTGKLVQVRMISTGFDYSTGIFKGSGVTGARRRAYQAEVHDTIAGFDEDEICQCVDAFATARVKGRRTVMRTYDKFCPER